MSTHETLRALTAPLPDVSERRSRSDRAAELVTNGRCFMSLPDEAPELAHAVTTEGALAALLSRPGGSFARAEGLRGCWVQIRLDALSADATWGPPIPIPLGQLPAAAVSSILAEMRQRLEATATRSEA